nr:MAG TPA: hypothetical protein [Caudoviricetes sp.]
MQCIYRALANQLKELTTTPYLHTIKFRPHKL